MEENHYYVYGLRIAGISSRALVDPREGHAANFNFYKDKELFEEADLDWYDYGFRSYDPQIGRLMQLDPLTDAYPFQTPYQYASCDPVTNIDQPVLVTARIAKAGGGLLGFGRTADAATAGNQAKFLQLFDQYVKQPLLENPNMLNKTGW